MNSTQEFRQYTKIRAAISTQSVPAPELQEELVNFDYMRKKAATSWLSRQELLHR